jgi:hypothetical protein
MAGMLTHHSRTTDVLVEITNVFNDFADINTMLNGYTEYLNTALFAGTAYWDIVIIPSTFVMDTLFDINAFIRRGMLHDLLPHTAETFDDKERFYTHLIELLKHDGGLYHIPGGISIPFILVPNDHPELEYLTQRAHDWTWADFWTIVQRMEIETGQPQVSGNDSFNIGSVNPLPHFAPNPISNVPPFFLFDEALLFDMGMGRRYDEFGESIALFALLANPLYNAPDTSTFTFACTRSLSFGVTDTHTPLPMPVMRGEYIFYELFFGHAVLTAGTGTEIAADFLLKDYITQNTSQTVTGIPTLTSFERPTLSSIQNIMSIEAFEAYEYIVYRANALPSLPGNIRLNIYDTIMQYVHGVLTIDAAVSRVADIMWLYINE